MGFKDGTMNPKGAQLDKFVWVGSEGPRWMQGGAVVHGLPTGPRKGFIPIFQNLAENDALGSSPPRPGAS